MKKEVLKRGAVIIIILLILILISIFILFATRKESITTKTILAPDKQQIKSPSEFPSKNSLEKEFLGYFSEKKVIFPKQAMHLDSERKIIGNFYEQIKELDNLWTKIIYPGDYVRVTFEENLTSTDDITIYPRIISGNPIIEVYEFNSKLKIAEFNFLINETYNKIILTNITEEQNTFDLKILNGEIQFNQIIDPPPPTVYNMNPAHSAVFGRPTSSNRWQAGTNASLTQYNNMNSENLVYADNTMPSGNNDEPFWRFNFTINELTSSITSVYIKFTGYENATGWGESATLYIWRFSDGNWVSLGSLNQGSNGNIIQNITTGIGNYIDNYQQLVLAVEGSNFDRGDSLVVDHVQIIVQFIDTTPPTFTSIPSNSYLFYRNQSLGVDFNAIDETGLDSYSINDTRFSISSSGYLTNSTPMAVGNYLINVTINDTSNNINWTLYRVQVNKSLDSCGIYFNKNSPITFPEIFIAYTNCTSTYTLYRNETPINNASAINSGAGAYNISVQRTDTQNYSNTFSQEQFIVNKNPEKCRVLFNETFPLESPSPFLVWANCSTPFKLYRNETLIENNSKQILGFGAYNFSMLREDSLNYSTYYNETEIIMQDTTYPAVDFGVSSPKNNSKFARTWIYIDASVVEYNEKNITFELYNLNLGLVNSSTYTDSRRQINWTDLPEGIYYCNITVFDVVGHSNSSSTRKITLNFTLPTLNYAYPTENNGVSRSKDWIYVNVSASNVNEEANITFELHNSDSGLVNSSTYTDSRRQINWTSLPEGLYYYNVTLFDVFDGEISTLTRQITLDTTSPNATLLFPENNTYTNVPSQNLTVNLSDNLGLANMTLSVYNETNLINQTTQEVSGTKIITGILYTFAYEGIFNWSYRAYDLAGISSETQNNTLTIDTISPKINYVYPTENNQVNKSQNFVFVNLSVNETNEANITFELHNSDSGLVNSSTYTDSRRQINWTNLQEGFYYYNVTIVDLAYNVNYTQTRKIGLDTTSPTITIINPKPKAYGYNESLPLSHTVSDNVVGLSACWWNLDNQANQSIPCNTETSFNTTEDSHTLYFYSNDTLNHISVKSVSFLISLTAPVVILTNPSDNSYFTSPQNIPLNYTASDPDGIDVCSLYGTWNSAWHFNQSDLNWFVKSRKSFFDNFDDGDLGSNWTTYSSNSYSRINLRTDDSYSPNYAVIADSNINNQYELSELITAKDFTGAENIILNFWYREWGDENNAGADHAGHYNGEGVYFTCDGTYWYNVYNLLGTSSWQNININISADSDFCSEINSNFAIKFTQYDNFGLTSDGIGWDSINISYTSRDYQIEGNSSFLINLDSDGSYLWNVECNDSLGYSAFAAANSSFIIDTTYPKVDFAYPTENDNANISHNYIFVNVSVVEENPKNITFNLYDEDYVLVNSSTYTDSRRTINWTDLSDGFYYYNVTVFDYVNYSNTTSTRKIGLDTHYPQIEFTYPTEDNDSAFEKDWIFVNVSVNEANEVNITFTLYYSNYTLVNSSTYTDSRRQINWTNLDQGNYSYNVTIIDIALNQNSTETRTLKIVMIPPVVNLIYPSNYFNFSGYGVSQFNYSVEDNSSILNCSLYGDWIGEWHLNQTTDFPEKGIENNFSAIYTLGDGYYLWNVRCYDFYGNMGENSTNFTFATFLPPDSFDESILNATQSSNDGKGNVTLVWNFSNHSTIYKIYYTEDPHQEFSLLSQTPENNYTDTTANQTRRRFYKISGWNPSGENFSSVYGKTVYYLKRKENANTRNWIGFYLENNLSDANQSLHEINNLTSFTMFNSTLQSRVTCNLFSCPEFPACTETNCNFELENATGYEVNVNSSFSVFSNWSSVGKTKEPLSKQLTRNSTSFGENWVSIYYNTSLENAENLLNLISFADALTYWDNFNQTSVGYVEYPYPWVPYVGENFAIEPEKGYEVSVTQDTTYTQT